MKQVMRQVIYEHSSGKLLLLLSFVVLVAAQEIRRALF